MTITTQIVDFRWVIDQFEGPSGVIGREEGESPYLHGVKSRGRFDIPRSSTGSILTPKQIRRRVRRRAARSDILTTEEYKIMFKPVEDWDMEELARGRPRNSRGTFTGPKPKWLSTTVHESAMDRFKQIVKMEMNRQTTGALKVFEEVMSNDEVDVRGRPVVPASTKLDAAKFLLEHVVGKPTQRIENDVSVKLQSILGVVMANPDNQGGYAVGHLPGVTVPMAIESEIVDAEVEDE